MGELWKKVKSALGFGLPDDEPQPTDFEDDLALMQPETGAPPPKPVLLEEKILNFDRHCFGSRACRLMGHPPVRAGSAGILNASRHHWRSFKSNILNADRYDWTGPHTWVLNGDRHRWKVLI